MPSSWCSSKQQSKLGQTLHVFCYTKTAHWLLRFAHKHSKCEAGVHAHACFRWAL
jgi:hypothetical protein